MRIFLIMLLSLPVFAQVSEEKKQRIKKWATQKVAHMYKNAVYDDDAVFDREVRRSISRFSEIAIMIEELASVAYREDPKPYSSDEIKRKIYEEAKAYILDDDAQELLFFASMDRDSILLEIKAIINTINNKYYNMGKVFSIAEESKNLPATESKPHQQPTKKTTPVQVENIKPEPGGYTEVTAEKPSIVGPVLLVVTAIGIISAILIPTLTKTKSTRRRRRRR